MNADDTGGRRLSAADVNKMAQALDDSALPARAGADPNSGQPAVGSVGASDVGDVGDVAGLPDDEQQVAGDNPLEGQEGEAQAGLYPPNVVPDVEIGGGVEEQAALEHEYRHP